MNPVSFFLLFISLALGGATAADAKTLFARPIGSYAGIYQFYDHAGKDWGCGTKRYSGHRGTDFTGNGTTVKNAAKGDLYYRYDGCSDSGYIGSTCGSGYGNHARVKHADGRVTIYAHMRKGSVRGTTSGLSCGTSVGYAGQSGSASAPHLHFELWSNTSASSRLDPYYGACDTGASTDWVAQSAYSNGNVSTTCQ
jgi:murein DD-endopeptidase MepM/ murein hydrolase activator NlpD